MLKHLLLSHHGQYEYGSPKRPKFVEAVVLSFIDDLDSKINGIQTHIDKEPNRDSNWTNYHRLYDRYFYKGPSPAKEPSEIAAPVAAAPAPAEVAARPQQDNRAKKNPQRFNQPLGATLAEQLKDKNLDLFSALNDKEENR